MNTRKERLSGVDSIQPRAPRIGKLKIGETREKTAAGGKVITYPSKLDYIKAVDAAGCRIDSFHEIYGEKPTEFLAVLPTNDPRDWYWESYRRYGLGTGLACHGDGHNAVVEETGESIECPCHFAEPTVKNDKEHPPACKIMASVSLWLFEIPELGLFQIDTGGFRSMSNLKWFVTVGLPSLSGGQLAGIPIRVYIEPFQAVHEGKASVAYSWKFGLPRGMKPSDVRIAAEKAVEGFVLPTDVGPLQLDEAKPEDLYAGLPPADEEPERGIVTEVSLEGPTVEAAIESEPSDGIDEWANLEQALAPPEEKNFDLAYCPPEWRQQVAVQEDRLTNALGSVVLPPAKAADVLKAVNEHRDIALTGGNWDHYIKWLDRQSKTLEAKAAQGKLT